MSRLLLNQIYNGHTRILKLLLLSAKVLLLLIAGISSSQAANYIIDPTQTNVRFAIGYFNVSNNTTNMGGFYNVKGQLQYDAKAKTGNVSLIIPINTLSTGKKALDIKLTGSDFFDMQQFPLAYFQSNKWHFTPNKLRSELTKIDGQLTMHGETHPVTLTTTQFDCYLRPIVKKSVCAGKFTTSIDRTQWNLNKYTLLGITKNLTLNIQVEAVRQ